MAAGTLSLDKSNAPERKTRTPFGDAMHQLFNNRLAIAGMTIIALLILIAIFAPLIAPHPFDGANFQYVHESPQTVTEDGRLFLLGTDNLGRDTLSRTIYGTRISLAVAFVASIVSLIIGVVYGLIAGYSSKTVDNIMMRFVDFIWAIPFIVLIILIQVAVKAFSAREAGGIAGAVLSLDRASGGILILFIAIGLFNWLGMARIARGQTLSLKNKEFVEAARATGASDFKIIFKHILPNILGPCLIYESLAIPGYILLESFLSFIGLGVNPPTPSWGIMISDEVGSLRPYPFALFTPAIALTITVLAFNFLGDGLRDAFDPRMRDE